MKTMRILIIAAMAMLATLIANNSSKAQVNVDVSFNVFYESLKPHGFWFNYGQYGMCWRPHGVSISWQPYRDGHWVWTNYGWTWISDYSWGWAPFHYGRWTYDDYYGWIWVPDYEWSPAWVQWRYDSDYIGWAPLPPKAVFRFSIGVDINDFGISYHHWNYIYTRDMARVKYRFIPRHRIYKIHRHTTNITNITIINNNIYNYGPRINDIERASGSRIREYNIVYDRSLSRDRSNYRVENNNIHIYKPEITRSSGSTRNTDVNRDNNRTEPNINRPGDRIDRNTERTPTSRPAIEQPADRGSRENSANRTETRSEQNRQHKQNSPAVRESKPEYKIEGRKNESTINRDSDRSRSNETRERNSEKRQRSGETRERNSEKRERSRNR